MAQPTQCLAPEITPQTVYLAGVPINLAQISREHGLDHSYLSRIFAGKQNPSIKTSRRIAAALGMHVGEFIEALVEKVQ
jgi:transcriptional regulator with XRE-family HTH domain